MIGRPAGYVYDNDLAFAGDQHRWLSEMLDPITTARLAGTGITTGWDCLDVGAGGGSIAAWLAARVAPTGSVLATDIKPGRIVAVPGLRVELHDIVCDALPEAAFDLIVARQVLFHLPQRRTVLDKLVSALRPGGWLQLDELDVTYGPALLVPDRRAHDLYDEFLSTKAEILRMAGADPAWGRHAPQAMREAGLVAIDPAVHVEVWHSGSAGIHLLVHHSVHLRDRFLEAGMTDGQLEEFRQLLSDARFRASSCGIYSIQGRRPGV